LENPILFSLFQSELRKHMSPPTGSSSSAPFTAGTTPEVLAISHSGLLYWWPVWLVGFILSGLTYLDEGRLAIVPDGTKVKEVSASTLELILPDKPSRALIHAVEAAELGNNPFPIRISNSRNLGAVYVAVLLLVIVGTTIPLRGLGSVAAVLGLLVITLLLAYFDVWDWILEHLWGLHIEISLAGFFLPSVVLLVLWLGTVYGLDRLHYVRFLPGQFIVHLGIGDARTIYDAARATVQKQRSGLLHQRILGLGTGDLIITVPGQSKEIILTNVVFASAKVRQIADLMKTRAVTTT
jgi:hypothetical protein